jgi:hypothetical protein
VRAWWWRRRRTVPFRRKAVKAYLDRCIRHSRKRRDSYPEGHPGKDMALASVDAFQSVRVSLFGELLPTDDPQWPKTEAWREVMG